MLGPLYPLADRLRDRARRRHTNAAFAAGRRGEDLAHRFLRRQGFTIVARNYRTPSGTGEIDLIGWERGRLAFIEIKTRATDEYGTPDRAVDAEKVQHLERAARDYARRAGADWKQARFDIVNVVLAMNPEIELLRDAFGPQRTL